MRDTFKFIEGVSAFAHRPRMNALIAFLGFFFFVFDLFVVPLGIAGGVPYVVLVLLATLYNNRGAIHTIALASSLLTILGFLFSPDGSTPWVVLTNRLLALLAIWATAFFANKFLIAYTSQQFQADRLRAQITSARNILNENDISRVFEVLCDEACRTLFAERALVEKVELDTEGAYQLSLVVSRNLPPDFKAYMEARVHPNAILESVLNSHQIEVIHPEEDSRTSEAQREAEHKTNCFIPIIAHGIPFGALILYHLTRREYDQEDLGLARSFGELASLAVKKSIDIKMAEARANRLAIINKITKSIGAELDPNELFNIAVTEIRKLIECDRCVVGRVDPNTMRIRHWHENTDRPIPIYAEGSSEVLWWYDDIYVKNQIVNITDFAKRSDLRAREFTNAGFRSSLLIPILKGETCIAHLSVSRKTVNAFSPEDEELLSAIATHLGPAVQNAELFQETEEQLAQLELVGAFSRELSTHSDLQSLFRYFTVEGKRFLSADRSAICLIDPHGQKHFLWHEGLSDTFINAVTDRPNPRAGTTVAQESEPIFIRDVTSDPRTAPMHDVIRGEGYFSVLHLPLRTETDSIGVASFYFDTDIIPTESQIKMTQTFTDYASVAIAKSKLFSDVEERATQLEVSKNISEAIGSELDPDTLFKTITREIRKIVPCERFVLASLDIEKKTYLYFHEDAEYPVGIPPEKEFASRFLIDELYEKNQPINIPNLLEKPMGVTRHINLGYKSLLAVPIMMEKGQNTHMLLSRTTANGFTESHEKMLTSIAPILGSAILNAGLYQKSQKRAENLALVNEISMVVGGELEPEELFRAIVTQIRKTLPCERCVIMSFDQAEGAFQYLYADAEVKLPGTMGLSLNDRPWVREVYETNAASIVRDFGEYNTTNARKLVNAGLHGGLYMPIIQIDQPVAHIGLARNEADSFTEEDAELLTNIAAHIGPAIRNARLFQQSQEQSKRLAITGEIARVIGSKIEPDQLFKTIVTEIRSIVPCERCSITGGLDLRNNSYQNWYAYSEHPPVKTALRENNKFTSWLTKNVYEQQSLKNIGDVHDESVDWGDIPESTWYKSMIFIPILQDGTCIAHINLGSSKLGAFTSEHERILTSISAHISPAIQNARLYEQSKKQTDQLTLIGEISRAVSAEIEPEAVFRAIVKEIRSALPCERCVITEFNVIDDSYQNWYTESDHEIKPLLMAKNKEFTRWIKRNIYELKKAVIIDDFHDPLLGWGEIPHAIWWKSLMIVPIVHDDHAIAHLSVSSSSLGTFTYEQKEFLTSVVGHLGPAIRNAALHKQTQAYNARLKTLNALSRKITQVLDLDEVLGNIASSTLSALEADHTRIYMLDEATGEFVRHAESGISSPRNNIHIKAGDGLAGIVIQNDEPVIMENANDITIPLDKEWFEKNDMHAFIGHPIRDKDKTIGLISCMSQKTGIFKQEDLEILAALASQATIAIQNARLFQTIEDRSAQLAEAQQIARLGNWRRDIHTGEVEWSDENYRIFGLAPQSIPITHSTYLDFIHPDEREKIKNSIQKSLDERNSYSLDIRIVRSDGIERNIHTETRIVLNEKGQPTAFIGTNQDITEQKQAEEEIRALNEELEARVEARTRELRDAQAELLKNERLATLGQLTATVSHEIRNPLGAMRTSTHVLAKKIQTDDEQVIEAIERIDRSIKRCDHIIDEFLDFTRIKKLELKNKPIDNWLEELITEQSIPKGVTLRCELELPGVMAPIDSERLRRAFINIFENAHQAMIAPDDLTKIIKGATLTVDTRMAADRVEISISDTGPGVPPDVLEKIYAPLFSTKNFGVGLGLPTAKQILDQHGGGLEINTGHGDGTRFTLWLPNAHIEESAHT